MKSVSSTMLGFTAPVYLPPIVNSNNTGTAKAGSSIINQPRRAGIVTEARINFCSSRSPRLSLLFFPYGTFSKEARGISNSRPFQSHPMNASSPSSARNWYKENAIFYYARLWPSARSCTCTRTRVRTYARRARARVGASIY